MTIDHRDLDVYAPREGEYRDCLIARMRKDFASEAKVSFDGPDGAPVLSERWAGYTAGTRADRRGPIGKLLGGDPRQSSTACEAAAPTPATAPAEEALPELSKWRHARREGYRESYTAEAGSLSIAIGRDYFDGLSFAGAEFSCWGPWEIRLEDAELSERPDFAPCGALSPLSPLAPDLIFEATDDALEFARAFAGEYLESPIVWNHEAARAEYPAFERRQRAAIAKLGYVPFSELTTAQRRLVDSDIASDRARAAALGIGFDRMVDRGLSPLLAGAVGAQARNAALALQIRAAASGNDQMKKWFKDWSAGIPNITEGLARSVADYIEANRADIFVGVSVRSALMALARADDGLHEACDGLKLRIAKDALTGKRTMMNPDESGQEKTLLDDPPPPEPASMRRGPRRFTPEEDRKRARRAANARSGKRPGRPRKKTM